MITVPIHDVSGKQVGTYEFDPADFAPSINKQLLHDVVVMYEHNRRQGNSKTKGRSEVAGSTQKIYRQKGTGRARMGGKRTGLRRGGGHTHNKVPVKYYYRLPRKAVRAATRMELLSKFQDGQAVVIDKLTLPELKTKHVAAALKALGLNKSSCLLAIEANDPSIWRSARNIESLDVVPAPELNAYGVLRQRRLLVTKAALDWLRQSKSSRAAE